VPIFFRRFTADDFDFFMILGVDKLKV